MSHVIVELKRRAVTLIEASEMLALSCITLRRAIRSGKLLAFRFGSRGAYRISIDEIDNFMKRSSSSPTEIEGVIEIKENVN